MTYLGFSWTKSVHIFTKKIPNMLNRNLVIQPNNEKQELTQPHDIIV